MQSLRESQAAMAAAIMGRTRLDHAGLEIYRYAYGARLEQTLRRNYPVLADRLGAGEFARLARRYAFDRSSAHWNIRWYGAQLWRLLDGVHADLARMEWALGIAFDAADATPLSWERLKDTPVERWSGLPLGLHPSTQVLAMSWSAERLWQGAAEASRHEHSLLVWRKGLQAHWRIATPTEAAMLRAVRALGTLDDACSAIPETEPDQIGAWFAGWVNEGMLIPGARA